jgi:hypothetical protein
MVASKRFEDDIFTKDKFGVFIGGGTAFQRRGWNIAGSPIRATSTTAGTSHFLATICHQKRQSFRIRFTDRLQRSFKVVIVQKHGHCQTR